MNGLKRLLKKYQKKDTLSFRKVSNPYPSWTNSLSPKYLLWEKYKQPISHLEDERFFSVKAIEFLRENAILIEEFKRIDRDKMPSDEDAKAPYFGPDDSATTFFYKNSLILCRNITDGLIGLDYYYPVSFQAPYAEFEKFIVERKGRSKVSILISRGNSLYANNVSFAPPVINDLELNYGTGFGEIHAKILEKLNNRKAGIQIFHGEPGTGKSTYIKYLTSICDREFIFIPVNMTDRLGSPEFLTLLMSKKEAVLILEDAERAVQARGTGGDDSAIATLLSISDGILGSLLDITVIVTYNANKQFIDPALLRKGRLSFEYDFGPLKTEDAQRLAKHLGKEIEINEPMTLANIYGADDFTNHEDLETKGTEMGFHTILSQLHQTSKEDNKNSST
jgi:hypothetical protein